LAELNALQGESLQDEPCPMGDKLWSPIGAGIYPAQNYSFFNTPFKANSVKAVDGKPPYLPAAAELYSCK